MKKAMKTTILSVFLFGSALGGTSGCETSGGSFALSELYRLGASSEPNPRRSALYSSVSNIALWEAQRQAANGQ